MRSLAISKKFVDAGGAKARARGVLLCVGCAAMSAWAGVSTAQPVEVVPIIGHAQPITTLAFGPDAQWYASSSRDGQIKLWNRETGRLLRSIRRESGSRLAGFAVSADGRLLAAPGKTGVEVFDTASGAPKMRLTNAAREYAHVAFSPNGRCLAVTSDDGVHLWEASSNRILWTSDPDAGLRGRRDVLAAVAVSGEWVATGGTRGNIKLWDFSTGRLLSVLEGGGHVADLRGRPNINDIVSLAASADGSLVAAAARNNNVRVWDVRSGRLVGETGISSQGLVVGQLAFAADAGSLIVAAGERLVVYTLSNAGSLETHATYELKPGASVLAVREAPDGTHFAVVGGVEGIGLFNLRTGELERQRSETPILFDGSLSLSPDGRHLLAAGPEEATLSWDLSTGVPSPSKCGKFRTDHVAVAGRSAIAFQNNDGKVAVCDERLSAFPHILGDAPSRFSRVVISPDGRLVGSVAQYRDERGLRVWEVQSGRAIIDVSREGTRSVSAAAFSTSNRWLATVGREETPAEGDMATLTLWNLQPGRRPSPVILRQPEYDDELALRFATDERKLLWVSSRKVRTIDVQTGRLLASADFEEDSFDRAAVSADLSLIVGMATWSSNVMHVVSATTGKKISSLMLPSGMPTALAITPDNAHLVVMGSDRTISMMRLDTGDLIVSFRADDKGDWYAITQEGFFASSPKGASLVNVVRGFEAVGADRLFQALYRPDLVEEKLAGDRSGNVKAAAAGLDLTRALASGAAPRLQIIAPQSDANLDGDEVQVEIDVAEGAGGVGRIEWRIDGTTLGVDESRGAGRYKRRFGLAPGRNVIEVVAYNAANLIASSPARVSVSSKPDATLAEPKLFILAVGVDAYDDPDLTLNFSVADATALAGALQQSAGPLFAEVAITKILNKDVTAARIEATFSEISQKIRPHDVLVFFIAGHGKTLGGRYFFIPPRFKLDGEASIREQAIGQELLQTWFSRVAARRSLFLSDTCESGSLTLSRADESGAAKIAALERLSEATGRIVLTASTKDAPALEGVQGHGVFTYAVLDALARGDRNEDRLLHVTEIEAFLRKRVPEVSERVFGRRQMPQTKLSGFDFPLGRPVQPIVGPEQVAISGSRGLKPVLIVTKKTRALSAPSAEGKAQTLLKRGEKLDVVKRQESWFLVAREGRPLGWISNQAATQLR